MSHPIAYLGLGSNLGDRAENLRQAVSTLEEEVLAVDAVSSVYETDPWGYSEQPPFLNAVCRVRTVLAPQQLLQELQRIEAMLGRRRAPGGAALGPVNQEGPPGKLPIERWGPRTVDLDILFYDDLVMETAELVIPHPRLHQRAFVLVPLAEIAPQLGHPRLGKTVAELLIEVAGREGVRLWAPPAHLRLSSRG